MLALPFSWEDRPHHVHVVDRRLDATGRARLAAALVDAVRSGARSTVVLPDGDDADVERWKGLGAEIVRGRRASGFLLRRTARRRRFLEDLAPDDVHVHGTPDDPSWTRSAARARLRDRLPERGSDPSPPHPSAARRENGGVAFVLKSDLGRPTAHVAQALQTVAGLASAGRSVTLVAPLSSSTLEEALDRCGVPGDAATRGRIAHRPIDPIRRHPASARALEAVLGSLRAEGALVLYFRQARIASMLLPAATRLGFRAFMEAHQPYVTWALSERRRLSAFEVAPPLPLARADRAYERRVYEALDGVVCTTRAMRRRVRRLSPTTPTLLLRNGAPDDFPDGVFDAPPVDVLYAGRTDPVKGTDVLIEALARLEGVTAAIVGGPTEADLAPLRARARLLGLCERVRFSTWEPQPALFARVKAARVVVHPLPGRGSREWRIFTCPLKLLEAMALGTPVVATDLPAVREVVRDGVTGVMVPPGDVAALAAGIARVLGDDAFAARLETAAARRVAKWSRRRRAARLDAFLFGGEDP